MTDTTFLLIGADIIAALVLTIGVYYPRHHRKDLVVAFLGVNIGVLAVATVLAGADVAAGLGLGLFGVLSIIRLRSSEISQREVAYYFASLAIGLLFGLPQQNLWAPIALAALIIAVLFVADHPALFARTQRQCVQLDRAMVDEDELRIELEHRLGARVRSLTVERIDLVNDTTTVDVRYTVPRVTERALAGVR